jgi:nucleoid DNA-binding protein
MAIVFVDELGVVDVKSRPARVGRHPAAGKAT